MEPIHIQVKTLVKALLSIVLCEGITGLIFSSQQPFTKRLLGLGGVRIIEIFLLSLILYRDRHTLPRPKNAIVGYTPYVLTGILKGLLWSMGFGLLVLIVAGIMTHIGINPLSLIKSGLTRKTPYLYLYLFVGGLLAPICEEIFFRGILYGFFRQWGIVCALLLSTFIFVGLHPMGGNIPVTQIVGGVLFAIAYEIEKNILVPIMIHMLGNIALFAIPLLASYRF